MSSSERKVHEATQMYGGHGGDAFDDGKIYTSIFYCFSKYKNRIAIASNNKIYFPTSYWCL